MKSAMSWFLVLFLTSVSFAGEKVNVTASAINNRCPVCGMYVAPYADWNASVVFADNTRLVFESSKDMFKYILNRAKYDPAGNREIVLVLAKDYSSRENIDAYKAFYVIWSDVYGPMGHEPIPFASEADAKMFMKEHRGQKILGFEDITPGLLNSMDNPE